MTAHDDAHPGGIRGGLKRSRGDTGQTASTREHITSRHQPEKWRRVLRALMRRSYTRFEAESDLHDHCLPSTVSSIQARGVRVDRRMETVSGYQGAPTRVARYWISQDQQEAARRILEAAAGTRARVA